MSTAAERLADAVLAEGYALYPYRASALKNRYRWQFGVLLPADDVDDAEAESDSLTCQVIFRGEQGARLDVAVRALHVEHRQVFDAAGRPVDEMEVGGRRHVTWEEGELRRVALSVRVPIAATRHDVVWPASVVEQPILERGQAVGAVRRERLEVALAIESGCEPVGEGLFRLGVVVRNATAGGSQERSEAARRSPVSTHVVLTATEGEFASSVTPDAGVAAHVAACHNDGVWPVLVGGHRWSPTVLAAPVILSDNPSLAPQSTGDLFDGTEIEELLALRIATLTPDEQRAAAATDTRVADAIARYLDPRQTGPLHARMVPTEQLEPSRRADQVDVGTRVRLRPRGGADAQDRFVDGRTATVVEVREDLDGRTHVAVQLDDDPGAELREDIGRHLYFAPDELEQL